MLLPRFHCHGPPARSSTIDSDRDLNANTVGYANQHHRDANRQPDAPSHYRHCFHYSYANSHHHPHAFADFYTIGDADSLGHAFTDAYLHLHAYANHHSQYHAYALTNGYADPISDAVPNDTKSIR